MAATSFWSQLVVARQTWQDKMEELGVPTTKSLQDILVWCNRNENKRFDEKDKLHRVRWSEDDNHKWREKVMDQLSNGLSKSAKRVVMILAQKSAALWNTLVNFVAAVDRCVIEL